MARASLDYDTGKCLIRLQIWWRELHQKGRRPDKKDGESFIKVRFGTYKVFIITDNGENFMNE